MKAKLNDGTEIECTPVEFIELRKLGLVNDSPKQDASIISEGKPFDLKKLLPTQQTKGRRSRLNWEVTEDNIIKEFYTNRRHGKRLKGPEFRKLCAVLSNRQKFQISKRAVELGLVNMKGTPPVAKVAKVDNRGNRNVERFQFMNKRANEYMRQYPNWNREKAYVQANADWNNQKLSLNPEQPIQKKIDNKIVEFPRFRMLTLSGNKILEDITKNIIGIGGSISYREAQYLPLESGDSWTVTTWKEFVNDFITKSEQIAQSFMTINKFKVRVGENGYITIKYGE